MRALTLCILLGAASALAEEAPPEPSGDVGLFSKAEQSALLVSVDLEYLRVDTITAGGSFEQTFKDSDNLMAVVRAEYIPPDSRWISAWVRLGGTVRSTGARGLDEKADADFLLAEINVGVSLVGRGSPLTPDDQARDSHAEAYIGLRRLEERYELKDFDYEAEITWTGPQLGLRGEWVLSDTYPERPEARGWSLGLSAALLPWVRLYDETHVLGTKIFYESSNKAYGLTWAANANYRRGALTFSAGYEYQHLRADTGEHVEASLDSDLSHARSMLGGFFAGVTVHF